MRIFPTTARGELAALIVGWLILLLAILGVIGSVFL